MKCPVLFSFLTFCIAITGIATAQSDWREPRHNPHLTALQPAPGAMTTAPHVLAEHDLDRGQAPITPVVIENGHLGLSIVAGTLYCHDTTGNLKWSAHPPGLNFEVLNRVADFDGDGQREILLQAGRPATPYGAAVLVDFETGALSWRYDVEPMSYQWYLYAGSYLPGRTDTQIFVVMMGYPPDPLNGYCALLAFDAPGAAPVQQWRYDFSEYTCFPGFLQSDIDGDGIQELVLQTHSRMWYLDAVTGALKHFAKWDVSPANVRSYGLTRFLDLNADGHDDFLCIANFAQHHEVLLNEGGAMVKAWHYGWQESVTTGKVATTWAEPPQADVDGDGKLEIVLSMYNSENENAWLTRVYDALDGTLKYRFPGVIAVRTADLDGDGRAEILGNVSADPTKNTLDGAQILSVKDGALAAQWEDNAARILEDSGNPVIAKENARFNPTFNAEGIIALAPVPAAAPPAPGPDFAKVPPLQGPPMPVLLAANLSGGPENELLLYSEPKVTVLRLEGDALVPAGDYESSAAPVIADFDGDGHLDLALTTVSPTALPAVRVVTPALENKVLWEAALPEPGRTGLPQPRKAYARAIHLTGKATPDLYLWAGTPVVRSAGLDGLTGALLWDKGEGPKERYWGPSVNFAAAQDFNGDGKEDLVFTNPDYYCVADGPTGEALHGPNFPPDIFKQASQGLYTFPAILAREGEVPEVCLVGGHYFQGGMSINAEPYWHQIMTPGPNRTGHEGFLTLEDGNWLMGFGRQNGNFACVDARTGALRWELPIDATSSDVISGDVDGDGRFEFVFATSHGHVMAVGDAGTEARVVWRGETGVAMGAPILADLDGDGAVEIACAASDGRVRVFGAKPAVASHPRLYFTPDELAQFQSRRDEGTSKLIWDNLITSAEWCLTKTPRQNYIAPVADDPIYENLYDRFYAMMMDMAIMEHLAFAYGLGGDVKYGEAARQWTLASCRAWKPDADAAPDGGKAYAVLRLLKGVAVAYDLTYDRFTPQERDEIVTMLCTTTDNYYRNYFRTPEKQSADFHTHHATVEFSSLGVVALALLDEAPEAREWMDFTTKKFEEHLLPMGLAADGAQIEGATFWASTMQYRLFYMDALRRVTGKDLYPAFKRYMNADLAFAQIAAPKEPGWSENDQSVILSPSYGQLDYYAPVLLALAKEYRDPLAQQLALWDKTLGTLQQTRYITRRGEQLLFEMGGYAALWHDLTVEVGPGGAQRSFAFPSVGEAYARSSWEPGDIVAGLRKNGEFVVHAGGHVVLATKASGTPEETKDAMVGIEDDDSTATLTRSLGGAVTTVVLDRPNVLRITWNGLEAPIEFHAHEIPTRDENTLTWEGGVLLNITTGSLDNLDPEGHVPALVVGMGKLTLQDPMAKKYPQVRVAPVNGTVKIEVRTTPK
jgi:hypothetical protein